MEAIKIKLFSRRRALTLSLLIFSVVVSGCSEEAGVRWTTNGKALDRKVLRLHPGTSVEDVRLQLGAPRLERDFGEEEALYYGLWQLVFTGRGLESWTRDYRSGWHRTTNRRALGRKILRFQLGTSVEDVRAKLGTPAAIQIYQNAPHKEESYWYGNGQWELSFTDGKLEGRTKF